LSNYKAGVRYERGSDYCSNLGQHFEKNMGNLLKVFGRYKNIPDQVLVYFTWPRHQVKARRVTLTLYVE
jgi:hypothetical protein